MFEWIELCGKNRVVEQCLHCHAVSWRLLGSGKGKNQTPRQGRTYSWGVEIVNERVYI
jgi:hypothetical protein